MRGGISVSTAEAEPRLHLQLCSPVSSVFVFSAFALLCLLKAVFVLAEKRYTWGGPGSSTDTVDPNTENGEEVEAAAVSSMCLASILGNLFPACVCHF